MYYIYRIERGDTMVHELIQTIRNAQTDLELSNKAFATYLGVSRDWVVSLWKNSDDVRRPMRNSTKFKLQNRLKIPSELFDEYNTWVQQIRSKGE